MRKKLSLPYLERALRAEFFGELDLDKAIELVTDVIAWTCTFGQNTPVHVLWTATEVGQVCIDVLAQKTDDPEAPLKFAARVVERSEIIDREGVDDLGRDLCELRVALLAVRAWLAAHEFAPALAETQMIIDVTENLSGIDVGRVHEMGFAPERLASLLRSDSKFASTYLLAISLGLFACYGSSVEVSEGPRRGNREPSLLHPLLQRAAVAVRVAPAKPDDARVGYHAVAFVRALLLARAAESALEQSEAHAAFDDEERLRPLDKHGRLSGAVAMAARAALDGDPAEAAHQISAVKNQYMEAGYSGYARHLDLCELNQLQS